MQTISFRHRQVIEIRRFWFKLKTLLRQNVNVDKNFFASDAAIKLTNGVLPQGTRVTCNGRADGVGMQALARMSGINFARAFGATYVDTPFRIVGHAPGEMRDWTEAWENLFNFGRDEEHIDDRDYKVVDYSDFLLNKCKVDENTVLRFQQCYWLHRRYPDSFKAVIPSFQEKFAFSRDREPGGNLIVAIHIRRGDVGANLNALRYTPNKQILKTIKSLEQISQDLNVKFLFEIFSQGNAEDFAEFSEIGCQLYLDTDAVWTVRKLAEADILVMSKSSFSYVAALINKGVKIYEPTFNPPLSNWIIKERDGSFDVALAERRLRDHLANDASGEASLCLLATGTPTPVPSAPPLSCL